jgi:hypothetical protein
VLLTRGRFGAALVLAAIATPALVFAARRRRDP